MLFEPVTRIRRSKSKGNFRLANLNEWKGGMYENHTVALITESLCRAEL